MLHLYTGDGKGKTTAAMGLALRALGHGRRVLVAQFMKNGRSGELEALRRFKNARVVEIPPTKKFTFQMTDDELAEAKRQQSVALESLIGFVEDEKPDMTILDELAITAHTGLVGNADALRLIDVALQYGEVIVTGRNAPPAIMDRADYVTEMVKRRHPYDSGVQARKGVEW
ncbi:MAG: cob(I)yrinic acid a,c-diamide adenosyltransferase [Oscillospiraceae bacterium]|jgi:cob(I)alamin adenosyltransferase|nr:cob(I)yrinic acid a,c-diamide adenosyltransferase [Oscillospiraceae bacterium]